MGNDHPRRLASAVVGRSRACVVATPYPAQFTRDDFNALQPFASVNRKLVAAGAEPVRWNALPKYRVNNLYDVETYRGMASPSARVNRRNPKPITLGVE